MTDLSSEGDVEEILLSSAQVCKIADISYRQLTHWLDCGYVKLVGEDRRTKPGSGHQRQFTCAEAEQVWLLAKLVKAGVRVCAAAAAVPTVTAEGVVRLPGDIEVRVA